MGEFDLLRASAAGMEAERSALDLAARNVAGAQATSDHGTFERLIPKFSVAPAPDDDEGIEPPDEPEAAFSDSGENASETPVIRYLGAGVERGADVDAVTEMVAVLDAQRAYEANASVFDIGKRLAERTIDMGRLQ